MEDGPVAACNSCAKVGDSKGWFMATIRPFANSMMEYSVICCSEECIDKYMNHPMTDLILAEQISKLSFIPDAAGLKPAYARMVDEFIKTRNSN